MSSGAAKKLKASSIDPSVHMPGQRRRRSTPPLATQRKGPPVGRRWLFLVLAGAVGIFLLVRQAFQTPATKRSEASAANAAPRKPTEPVAFVTVPRFESVVPEASQTTEGVLAARGSDCLACAKQNGCLDLEKQGGACEEAHGYATACGQGVSEKAMCLRILDGVFTSKCAETMQQVPCLCGTTDAEACLAGTETPTGPLYRDYQCSFNTTDVAAIQAKFRDPMFGAGLANALIQCLAGYSCNCFTN